MHIAKPEAMACLLSLPAAAEALGITSRGLRKHISAGRFGPAVVRLGRSVRVRRDELAAWIAADCPSRETWLGMRDSKLSPAGAQ